MKNEIQELQNTIDGLLKMVYGMAAQQEIFTSMVLGVYQETMKQEDYKAVYTRYVDMLEVSSNEMMNKLELVVYNKHRIVHEKFEAFSSIQDLKRSSSYVKRD
jgi:hypothetical protein